MVRRVLSAALDDLRHPQPALAGIAALSAIAFMALTLVVAGHPGPLAVDRSVEVGVQGVDFGPFGFWNSFVSLFAGITGLIAGLVVVVLVFIWDRASAPFVAISGLYSALYNGVMLVIKRPRPSGLRHTVHGLGSFSYPSGHEGFFLWVGVIFLLLFARRFPRPLFLASVAAVAVMVVMAGVSRMYVGAHWPTDVLGGFLVASAWICFTGSLQGLTAPLLSSSKRHNA